MTTTQLVADLARQNVQLWSDGEHLRVRAPRGVLTPDLQTRLTACKAEILTRLNEDHNSRSISRFPQIVPDRERRHDPFPLTDIQQAYWIGRSGAFDLGNVACHAYYEVDAKNFDLSRFNLALWRLIERHDMLRAIVLTDGRQQVLKDVPQYEIGTLDLRGLGPQEVPVILDRIRHHMSHQVLPADKWPLFDIRASRLDDIRVRLHFSFDMLIADVWSLQTLFREWAELYSDTNAQFPLLELGFRDYVLAEADLSYSPLHLSSKQYWAERVPNLPPAPELPLAAGPSSVTKPQFARRTARLEPQAWARIKSWAAETGLTPSCALLTAFTEVLAAWSKSPRFTINVTLLNRLPFHPQVKDIIGDFTSLIPLAVDTSIEEPFETRAGLIQLQLLEDMEHRFVSGVEVLRDVARVQGRTPGASMPIVFTSLLSQHANRIRADQTLWMGEVVYGISQTPQVWFDHQVLEEDGSLVFNWDAVEGLFVDGLLQDMFESYCSLLHRLAASQEAWREPTRGLLPPAQLRHRAAVNETEVAVAPALLHTLFQEQVSRRAQQPAIIMSNGSITFEQLHLLANHLGRKLRQMGAHPNTLIAVVMEKGWEQVAALLGILQSGAAYLPIDPCLPGERLRHLLDHGEVAIALTQSWIDGRLEWPSELRRLSVDTEEVSEADAEPIEPVQKPDDLAYVIYTSGSTGLPKGVMINHTGSVNTVLDINRRFDVRPGDRVFAISNLGFDLSVYDIFGTLAAGATIVMPDACATRDPEHWAELMRREKVTIWNSVPALMEMYVAHISGRSEHFTESLRLVMLSGDWIPLTLPGRIGELAGAVEVVSLGGATEASIWSILHPVERGSAYLASIPYGRPMDNQRFHVLSETMEPRPNCVLGNLYISGTGLALGYWRDEERTKASFIIHPRTGERLYRTGDLGRYLPDGNIEFLGREDSQVKVQGYRIELGEIETALGQHPGVLSAAVIAEGPRESKRLLAYVATSMGSQEATDELKQFLKAKLPAYMVPSSFVISESLPLTANGKVDRRSLPHLVKATEAQQTGPGEGAQSVEERIARCVARVLNLPHVTPDMNILELGANSIDIIRIAALIEKELKGRLKVEDFYNAPTPKRLARSCENGMWHDGEAEDSSAIRVCRKLARTTGCEEGEL
jgi:amino acid adenylation domain-containing protein